MNFPKLLADSAVHDPTPAEDAARGRVLAAHNAQIRDRASAQRGHVRAALLGVLLLAVVVFSALRCHPQLPPVAGCTPGASRCHDDRPEVCSGSQRWEPAGDDTCAAVGGVCVVDDARGARCARARDAGIGGDL
jgi:hypothetical protein